MGFGDIWKIDDQILWVLVQKLIFTGSKKLLNVFFTFELGCWKVKICFASPEKSESKIFGDAKPIFRSKNHIFQKSVFTFYSMFYVSRSEITHRERQGHTGNKQEITWNNKNTLFCGMLCYGNTMSIYVYCIIWIVEDYILFFVLIWMFSIT